MIPPLLVCGIFSIYNYIIPYFKGEVTKNLCHEPCYFGP